GVDLRAALLRPRERLEDEDARALTADEAVAALVEGAAGGLGIVVAAREGHHGLEAADADARDGRLRAAGDHDLGAPAADPLDRFADRVRAARAGARRAVARAAQAVVHRDLARGEVRDDARDGVGADLPRALGEERLLGALERLQAAEADAD